MSSKSLKVLSDQSSSCSTKPKINSYADSDRIKAKEFIGRAAIITLGCAKNQVDSEVMLGLLKQAGFEIVNDVERADIAIVNTCGFLQSAIEESLDCIMDLARLKGEGRLRSLVVAGCVVSRYQGDLEKELPEVDAFITTEQVLDIVNVIGGDKLPVLEKAARPYFLYDDTVPRQLSTESHYAYVKISEGCNRPCTFCIIPKIRGAMRSRKVDSILKEVDQLVDLGVKEINLIAQDLTSYGLDRKADSENLVTLLQALNSQARAEWIRLLYAYPVGSDDSLIEAIRDLPRVCTYLDIPLQHSSEALLKKMQRPIGRYAPRNLVPHIKSIAPSIAIRTTFIVGFPGETEADIDDLEDFIRAGHFSSVGIFTYSAEEGTPAAEMQEQVSEEEKQNRKSRLMLAQQEVLEEKLKDYLGKTLKVILEGTHSDTDMLLTARAEFQAVEVDSCILINDSEIDSELLKNGEFYQVEITEIAGYDLVGTTGIFFN